MAPVRVARVFRLPMMAIMTALALSGCMRTSAAVAVAQPQSDPDSFADAAVPMPVAHDAAYRLDAGDKLRVVDYGQEGLTNTYAIDAGGSITMPLIGAVPARGRTPADLALQISAKLRNGYIREPSVAVEIEAYRPFFILGEVAAPGQYPYVPNMSVESAVAIAGGFSPRARRDRVTATHTDRSGSMRVVVPLGPALSPSDTVLVGERWFARSTEYFVSPGVSETSEPGISRFRVWSFGPSRNDDKQLLLQILGKKSHAARPGDVGAGLVVARPLVAVEAVLRAGIDVDLEVGPLGADGLDIAERDPCILFAEMQLGRHFRLVVGEANDGAAVIADRRRQPRQFGRSRIGNAGAQ